MALTRLSVSYALGAFALALVLSMPIKVALAEDSDPIVARANGVDIHESDLALAEEEIGGNMPDMAPAQKRDYLVSYLDRRHRAVAGRRAAEARRPSGRQAPDQLRP